MTPDSVQWEEVVWVLVALVGLGFALWNGRESQHDLNAVIKSGTNGPRIMWAKFSRLLHITLIVIEVAFVAIGVVAMFRRPSPDATTSGQALLSLLLIGASVLLTSVSIRWLRVHSALSDTLEKQSRRDSAQDARSVRQVARTARQDRRETRQSRREQRQDARSEELDTEQNTRDR